MNQNPITWLLVTLGIKPGLQITIEHIFSIERPVDEKNRVHYQRPTIFLDPPPSYEHRKSVVTRMRLQNVYNKPIEIREFWCSLTFSPYDFWKKLKRGVWGEPYAMTLGYPPGSGGASLILPGNLASRDFAKTLLALYDANLGKPLPPSEAIFLDPGSPEQVWDLVIVLTDYMARALKGEGKYVSHVEISIPVPKRQVAGLRRKIADYPGSTMEKTYSEELVEQTIREIDMDKLKYY
jgi:hypothetical protein